VDTWPSNYSTTRPAASAPVTETRAPDASTRISETKIPDYKKSRVTVDEAPPIDEVSKITEKRPSSWIARLLGPRESDSNKTNSSTSWEMPTAAKTETFAPPPPVTREIEEVKADEHAAHEHVAGEPVVAEHQSEVLPSQSEAPLEQSHSSLSAEPAAEIHAVDNTPVSSTAAASSSDGNGANTAEMDAVVANVLSKLSPEVLQAVTREILKPVIAAMVQDELKLKK
jgi:hypothetical protein